MKWHMLLSKTESRGVVVWAHASCLSSKSRLGKILSWVKSSRFSSVPRYKFRDSMAWPLLSMYMTILPFEATYYMVKLSLCFNWEPRHNGVLGEWRYSFTHSLTSALDGGEWSISRPGRFTPRERAPGTHWIGGWVGPRAVLEAVVKRKIPISRWESNPRTPIVQPVA
jgi:hypothetical protein